MSYDPEATRRLTDEEIERLEYRLGVGVMLLNAEGKVFVAQRCDMKSEAWQMPQGGIDKDEDPLQAAFRELEEEIGTASAEPLAESHEWITYDLPVDLIPKLWKGRYRGQKQKWFAMRFTGSDAEINLETGDPEFNDWRWVNHVQLPDLIVPFKQDLYKRVLAAFSHLLQP
ncbi:MULTISPECIES: RNA pyrophosphohydrolase [Limibacillus]|jgi:putative (di)nucleoside polyphosphate hydrolase|uniref:RNA pyrophosphohydrolase n=1 Tax=Limibacillus halophilus TaxID=1579333 RepID=A0A839SVL7_9PROT|nr:RNA pyrophosphohydrolase [Limibacillus halophilus]MBB3066522.1 putative (di)nucleoside polyphosphate hydrolase [Limibacillus halophilus]